MLSWSVLVARAGVNPSEELENFTEGNPADISTLASDLAEAAGNQRLAADLDRQASAQLAASYHVDGRSPHDFRAHVQKVKRDLGDSGENLENISRRLGDISAELGDRTKAADTRYAEMTWEMIGVDRRFTALGERMAAMTTLELAASSEELEYERRKLEAHEVEIVRSAGSEIRRSGDEFARFLSGTLRMLGSMGYLPPDDLAEGPGDVDLTPGAGAQAGAAARAVLEGRPGAESLAALDRSRVGLEAIVASLGEGGVPTRDQADYISSYLNGMGADGLGRYADHVQVAAGGTPDTRDRVIGSGVRSLADGIAAVSRFDDGARMPSAVTGILHEPLGAQTPMGRFANASGDGAQGVSNLPRYEGLAQLVQQATTPLGSEFGAALGRSAIERKQDLNQIAATQNGPPAAFSTVVQQAAQGSTFDGRRMDASMSAMLALSAKDTTAGQAIVGDPTLRHALLGARWNDDAGAAAVLGTAVERSQPDAQHATKAAELAKTVVGEIGQDPAGWRELVPQGSGLSNALTDMGAEYVEVLGTPQTSGTESLDVLKPALPTGDGRVAAGFLLDGERTSGFLRFIAGDGVPPPSAGREGPREVEVDQDVQKLHAAVDLYVQRTLTTELVHGNPDDGEWKYPLRGMGEINGAIARAGYDVAIGAAVDEDAAAKSVWMDRRAGVITTERLLAEGLKVGMGMVPGLRDASGFVKDALNAQFDAGLLKIDSQPTLTAPQKSSLWLDEVFTDQEFRRSYVVARALENAGMLQEDEDPSNPNLPSMVDDQGSLRAYRELMGEGQHDRLRISAESGPREDYERWGDVIGFSDGAFRNRLPAGDYAAPVAVAELTPEQRMEMRYGPGWRSVPPEAPR